MHSLSLTLSIATLFSKRGEGGGSRRGLPALGSSRRRSDDEDEGDNPICPAFEKCATDLSAAVSDCSSSEDELGPFASLKDIVPQCCKARNDIDDGYLIVARGECNADSYDGNYLGL